MKEIETNKQAWGTLSKEHYEHFKTAILSGSCRLNPTILEEIGDIRGKTVLHLQCNTGADSIYACQIGRNRDRC